MLHVNNEGLFLNDLRHSITTKNTNKMCMDERTLKKVLIDLEQYKYISNQQGFYKLLEIKNYGMGYTRYYYSVSILLINKVITPQQYLVYLALVRNLQNGKDVAYNTLSNDLDIQPQNISRCIKVLHDKHVLMIEKVYTEKGLLANRYLPVA